VSAVSSPDCTGIYITNLHTSIDSAMLYGIFCKAGSIEKHYVATNKTSGKSLGFGVIRFREAKDAQFAVTKFHGLMIKEQEISVTFYKSPCERESEKPFTNLFVKNFQGAFESDLEFLQEFRPFGNIASHKIEKDENTGTFKGFGFVAYDNPDDARVAVMNLHGKILRTGKALFVSKHKTKEDLQRSRNMSNPPPSPTRIGTPIGPRPLSSQERIHSVTRGQSQPCQVRMYSGRGRVHSTSGFRPQNRMGTNAPRAYVVRQPITPMPRAHHPTRFHPPVIIPSRPGSNNVYVKNLKGFIDCNDELFNLFKKFGKIISAIVMKEESGISKGFGFVCFQNVADAELAVEVMNNKTLPTGKLLYCGTAQLKNDRQMELRAKFRENSHLRRTHCIERRKRNGLSSSESYMDTLCNICYEEVSPGESVLLDCKHVNCKTCLTDWYNVLINERQVNSFLCISEACEMKISPALVKALVSPKMYEKYDTILLENLLATLDDVVSHYFTIEFKNILSDNFIRTKISGFVIADSLPTSRM